MKPLNEEDYIRGEELYNAIDDYFAQLIQEDKAKFIDVHNVMVKFAVVLGVKLGEHNE